MTELPSLDYEGTTYEELKVEISDGFMGETGDLIREHARAVVALRELTETRALYSLRQFAGRVRGAATGLGKMELSPTATWEEFTRFCDETIEAVTSLRVQLNEISRVKDTDYQVIAHEGEAYVVHRGEQASYDEPPNDTLMGSVGDLIRYSDRLAEQLAAVQKLRDRWQKAGHNPVDPITDLDAALQEAKPGE